MYVKRDVCRWQNTYQRDPQLPDTETCKRDLLIFGCRIPETLYVKRDMYVWKGTYKRDLQLPVKKGCEKELLTSFLPHSSDTAYLSKGTCIYEKRPTKKDSPTLFHLWHDTCVKRDMYIWKQTCIYEKRPIQETNWLSLIATSDTTGMSKETCIHEKRLVKQIC